MHLTWRSYLSRKPNAYLKGGLYELVMKKEGLISLSYDLPYSFLKLSSILKVEGMGGEVPCASLFTMSIIVITDFWLCWIFSGFSLAPTNNWTVAFWRSLEEEESNCKEHVNTCLHTPISNARQPQSNPSCPVKLSMTTIRNLFGRLALMWFRKLITVTSKCF